MKKQDFINMGGKLWEKHGKTRVYINAEQFNRTCETSFGDSNNRFFFDCETNSLMRSYKGKKPKVELQFLTIYKGV